ncbi:MAG: capsular polysaccharide synthesis protein [Lachnospiraceae bacterium]|nr:capsular polysaccharide synthesis protein [Lachnospiraceae bacterium]
MRSLLVKIRNNFEDISKEWKRDIREYSWSLALTRFMGTMFRILRLNSASTAFLNRKNDIVLSYLEKKYGYIFLRYKDEKNTEMPKIKDIDRLPIWVCWLDGIENAPPLVRRCVDSIYRHANSHPVNLITWEKISDYVDMPPFLKDKVLRKQMGCAHYSDILRVFLLEKYGGIWLDATIFCSRDLPEEYFTYNFFSCKSDRATSGCISNNQWTTFCLGGCKGNVLFKALKAFYLEYWEQETCAIDYLFFDDAIELARRLLPEVNKEIDQVPQTNDRRDELIQRFEDAWTEGIVDDLMKSDTIIFKLGYREKRFLQTTDGDGNSTVYAAFLQGLF